MIFNSRVGLVVGISLVTGVVVLGLVASMITADSTKTSDGYWLTASRSDMLLLFITSCMATMFSGLLIITSFAGDAEDSVIKTHFFLAVQIVLAVFYLASSIALLAKTDKIDKVIASGVFGLVSGLLHLAISIMIGYYNSI